MDKAYLLYLKYCLRMYVTWEDSRPHQLVGKLLSITGITSKAKVIIGLTFDCVDKVVYWTDISEPSIGRASLHGGEPTTIIRQGRQANVAPLGCCFQQPTLLLVGSEEWRVSRFARSYVRQEAGLLPLHSVLFISSEVFHRPVESLNQGLSG